MNPPNQPKPPQFLAIKDGDVVRFNAYGGASLCFQSWGGWSLVVHPDPAQATHATDADHVVVLAASRVSDDVCLFGVLPGFSSSNLTVHPFTLRSSLALLRAVSADPMAIVTALQNLAR